MPIIQSKNGVPIRFPDERWEHIVEGHQEMARRKSQVVETIRNPDRIVEGTHDGEFLAGKRLRNGSWVIVVYKEIADDDGFVITAWTSKTDTDLSNRTQIWP